MGCVVSSEGDDDRRRRIIGVSAAAAGSHHIVSLTSSTYGILTAPTAYDTTESSSPTAAVLVAVTPPPPAPAPPHVVVAVTPAPPPPPPAPQQQQPSSSPVEEGEVINSWELMAGLLDPSSSSSTPVPANNNSYRTPTRRRRLPLRPIPSPAPSDDAVLYTTSLRALRPTFEACNAVRAALQAHGVAFRERDVSMDRGFRDDLRRLLGPKAPPPQLFVRGRHVGGADEVLRMDEDGKLAPLLEGLPKPRGGTYSCDGCGGIRFLPCFDCSGSRKLPVVPPVPNNHNAKSISRRRTLPPLVVRCRECNENGLVLCPICS